MLIIIGILLLALALWVVYLVIIGGVGFVVALKAIFTGFRQGWKDSATDPKVIASRERLAAERARTRQILADKKAARAARKASRNAR